MKCSQGCRLRVTIHEAKDLRKAGLFDKNDVYIQIATGLFLTARTSVKKDAGSFASFEETLELEWLPERYLEVAAFDEDKHSKDDLIGSTQISPDTISIGHWRGIVVLQYDNKPAGVVDLTLKLLC